MSYNLGKLFPIEMNNVEDLISRKSEVRSWYRKVLMKAK